MRWRDVFSTLSLVRCLMAGDLSTFGERYSSHFPYSFCVKGWDCFSQESEGKHLIVKNCLPVYDTHTHTHKYIISILWLSTLHLGNYSSKLQTYFHRAFLEWLLLWHPFIQVLWRALDMFDWWTFTLFLSSVAPQSDCQSLWQLLLYVFFTLTSLSSPSGQVTQTRVLKILCSFS